MQICWNFFAEKMWVAFAVQKMSEYCILNPIEQLTKWPLTSSLSYRRFEQLGPGCEINIMNFWLVRLTRALISLVNVHVDNNRKDILVSVYTESIVISRPQNVHGIVLRAMP